MTNNVTFLTRNPDIWAELQAVNALNEASKLDENLNMEDAVSCSEPLDNNGQVEDDEGVMVSDMPISTPIATQTTITARVSQDRPANAPFMMVDTTLEPVKRIAEKVLNDFKRNIQRNVGEIAGGIGGATIGFVASLGLLSSQTVADFVWSATKYIAERCNRSYNKSFTYPLANRLTIGMVVLPPIIGTAAGLVIGGGVQYAVRKLKDVNREKL